MPVRIAGWLFGSLAVLLSGPLLVLAFGSASLHADWRTASQRAAGLAPDPATHPEATVQAYAGRAFGWRGAFAVHTWLAVKPAGAAHYMRYEVIGWNLRYADTSVSVSALRAPDAEWYGAAPQLLAEVRGADAESVIARLPQVVAAYPDAPRYRLWPGPNSNTFIAYLGRSLPELHLALPSNAIGKDFLPDGRICTSAPSGTGYQCSLFGLFGILAAVDEGIEVNLLGLVFGIDFRHPALKLPGIGRL